MGSGFLLALSLCVVSLSGMLVPVFAGVSRYPSCGQVSYFNHFMKCDGSFEYCFEYDHSSCIGPSNWTCVNSLNRAAGLLDGAPDTRIRREGLGNTRCCGGRYNSPIDIASSDAVRLCRYLPTPRYTNPNLVVKGHLENKGVYPIFKVEADYFKRPLFLTEVPFTCVMPGSPDYVFTGLHVHTRGSEHRVNGKEYDGELHIVHARRDYWSPFTQDIDTRCATQTPLGLVVLAVFLSTTEGEYNAEFNNLFSKERLQRIQKSEEKCPFVKICNNNLIDVNDKNGDGRNNENFYDEVCEEIKNNNIDGGPNVDNNFVDGGKNGNKQFGYFADSGKGNGYGVGNGDRNRGKSGNGNGKGSSNGNRRVRCFCRRRTYMERYLALCGARFGDQYACKRKYRKNVHGANIRPVLEGKNHKKCSHNGHGGACEHKAMKDYDVRPAKLLPRNKQFYQYFGGLTSPPCSEVVNWIVFKTPLKITLEQLDLIGKMETTREGGHIKDFGNIRPPQPLNDRIVSTNSCY